MNLLYVVSDFVPVVLALVIIWHSAFYERGRALLKKAILPLLILGAIGLVNALAESVALQQGIWSYNNPRTLGISIFGVYFETYIYCILVPITIASAAIKFAERQDRKHEK